MAEQHGKALVPQIRFAGFTDPWEQRKLRELLLERNEQAPQSDQYPLMAFIANQGIAPKGDRYDRSALVNDVEGKLYKRTEKGDFIYSSNNLETGSIGLNKYGDACISPVYSIFQPSGIADSDFLGRRLVRKDFIHEMVKWRQGVIYGQWRIHEADFLRLSIVVPSVNEQRLIGKLLDNLDSLITLHQRKYDRLCVLKKSMLDKMFPKGGSLYPEIRFAGFTDPWEQRKLGEVASGFEYGLNAAASDFDGEKKYLRITDIDDQTREFRTDDLSSPDINNPIDDRYLLKEGDILFARTGASVGKTYLYKASDGKTYYAGFLIRAHVSDEADAGFIFQSTLTERYKQFVLLTSQRSGQPGINAQEYSDLLLPLPSLMEQRRIGAFFDRLDSLITLHQRKYDGCANPLFLERRISCRKPSHQNRCSATTTPSG